MAQVYTEPARYACQETVRQRRKLLTVALVALGLLCVTWGISIGLSLHTFKVPIWLTGVFSIISLTLIWGTSKWLLPKLDTLEKQRLNWERGTNGEDLVAKALLRFPSEFKVINDLSTPYGNLDHVVVGPTGVFVLDAKNWRGVVASDGKGELLCNGKPTDKPYVRRFVSRVMGTKEKIEVLAPGLDPYFQAVFVFTSARAEAKWGTTGKVHCIRDEQIFDYIVESKRRKILNQREVDRIAQAFLGLANMDTDFRVRAESNAKAHIP